MTDFDDEMMKALEADGEKLRQLTGKDHGPFPFPHIAGAKDTGSCLADAYGAAHVAVVQWEDGAPASTVLDTARRAAEELRQAIARLEAHTGD